MHRKMIRIAGNTHNPALLALREKGYRTWIEPTDDEGSLADWSAPRARCDTQVGCSDELAVVTSAQPEASLELG